MINLLTFVCPWLPHVASMALLAAARRGRGEIFFELRLHSVRGAKIFLASAPVPQPPGVEANAFRAHQN